MLQIYYSGGFFSQFLSDGIKQLVEWKKITSIWTWTLASYVSSLNSTVLLSANKVSDMLEPFYPGSSLLHNVLSLAQIQLKHKLSPVQTWLCFICIVVKFSSVWFKWLGNYSWKSDLSLKWNTSVILNTCIILNWIINPLFKIWSNDFEDYSKQYHNRKGKIMWKALHKVLVNNGAAWFVCIQTHSVFNPAKLSKASYTSSWCRNIKSQIHEKKTFCNDTWLWAGVLNLGPKG